MHFSFYKSFSLPTTCHCHPIIDNCTPAVWPEFAATLLWCYWHPIGTFSVDYRLTGYCTSLCVWIRSHHAMLWDYQHNTYLTKIARKAVFLVILISLCALQAFLVLFLLVADMCVTCISVVSVFKASIQIEYK